MNKLVLMILALSLFLLPLVSSQIYQVESNWSALTTRSFDNSTSTFSFCYMGVDTINPITPPIVISRCYVQINLSAITIPTNATIINATLNGRQWQSIVQYDQYQQVPVRVLQSFVDNPTIFSSQTKSNQFCGSIQGNGLVNASCNNTPETTFDWNFSTGLIPSSYDSGIPITNMFVQERNQNQSYITLLLQANETPVAGKIGTFQFRGSTDINQGFRPTVNVFYLCNSDYNVILSTENCFNSTNYVLNQTYRDSNGCNATNYSTVTYPTLLYLLTENTTICFNSTNLETTWIYNDTKTCGYSIINYTYPILEYFNTQNQTNCFNSTNLQFREIFNDTFSCNYYYFVDEYPILNYQFNLSYNNCYDYNTQRQNFVWEDISSCGYNITNNTDNLCEFGCLDGYCREPIIRRNLKDIGTGTGLFYEGFGPGLIIFLISLSVAIMVGLIINGLSKRI
jgi:hypothetical protein